MDNEDVKVLAIVGAQYGSEGKGVIVKHLANRFDIHIRTGGPNAGHTFVHNNERFVARSLPIGWTNPNAKLVIGPGAVIHKELLVTEVESLVDVDSTIRDRLYVDARATLITDEHRAVEGGVDGFAHLKIGSTGEGVGPARMSRLSRRTFPDIDWLRCRLVGDNLGFFQENRIRVTDTIEIVNSAIDAKLKVLLEGTQGSGLSLTHGIWPFVTSADTNAGQFAVDAGIAPCMVDSLLVARTFPIRVAGNSGPMREISWEELGVTPETTTVTKKQRRIGLFEDEQFSRAQTLNRPIAAALTFLDYEDPACKGAETWDDLTQDARDYVQAFEIRHSIPVPLISNGPAGSPIIENPEHTGWFKWVGNWSS